MERLPLMAAIFLEFCDAKGSDLFRKIISAIEAQTMRHIATLIYFTPTLIMLSLSWAFWSWVLG